MNGSTVELRLTDVERRLRRVELWVGMPPEREPAEERAAALRETAVAAAEMTPMPVIPLTEEATALPPPPPVIAAGAETEPGWLDLEQDVPAKAPKLVAPPPLPPEALRPRHVGYQPVIPPRPMPVAEQGGVERAIGLKWAGWVGAIVLVIGAGLGIKFAYDNGWFAAIPAGLRVALIAAAGLALIGAGEWVFRRVEQLAAVGLFSAGVAILFVDSYAGFRFYNLYPREVAFALMAVSTLLGAGVAMRGRLVSIAVLSILGGQIAPALLAGPTPNLTAFLGYLLVLQAIALVLAWWGGQPKWWTLRGLSLACTAVWVLAVADKLPGSGAALPFLLTSAAMFHAELIVTSGYRASAATGRTRGVIFSTLTTAGLTAGLLLALGHASDAARGTAVILVAAACAVIGFALPGNRMNWNWSALRIAYRVQAAGLLIIAVPVWFSGINVEIGWAVLAVAYAVFAAVLDVPIARAAAVVTWSLAAGHLAQRSGANSREFEWLGTHVSALTLEAWALAAVAQLIAILTARSAKAVLQAAQIAVAASVMGTIYFVCTSLGALPPLGATVALAAYAWLLVAVDRVEPRSRAAIQAVAAIALATAKWAVVDLLAERLSSGWSASQRAAVLNPAMAVGGLLAVTIAAMGWLWRGRLIANLERRGSGERAARDATVLIGGLVIALMAIGLSFEVDRVVEQRLWSRAAPMLWPAGQLKELLWTVLWSAACAAFCGLARWIGASEEWLRAAGRLAVVLAVKFLLIDAIGYRLADGVALAPPMVNAQVIAALAVVGALAASRLRGQPIVFLIVLVLLVTGAGEIDRAFERFAAAGSMPRLQAELAKQVALSIYGGVFAVASVVVGFRWPSAAARYFGLGLFGLTLLKVVLVDLQNAGQGYRVLSFIGVGLLLLGTSVLYGKLSPRLLAVTPQERSPLPQEAQTPGA